MYETLENRRLMAVAPWSLNVNFQTPQAPSVPAGYRSDYGAVYARRANGATYGFSADMTGEAINRNHPRSPDERYDTFNYLRDGQTWELKVPERGAYQIRVVAGDPKVFNSVVRVAAEGVMAVEGTVTSSRPWADGTTIVDVADGVLTLTAAPGSANNKLCFVEVSRVDPPAAPPAAASGTRAVPLLPTTNRVTWVDNSDNETGFKVERKRGRVGSFETVAIVGPNVRRLYDEPLRPGTQYTYRVRAFNAAGGAAASNQATARTPDVATIAWNAVAPSPIQRAEAMTAAIDDKLYVFGGFNGSDGPTVRSDAYDPAADAWARLPDMPRRLTHAGVAVDGRNVYFAGGYIGTGPGFEQQFGTPEVWRYNVDSGDWSRMPDLPAPLASGGLVALGRELHYFGGNNADRQDVGVHYVLNLDAPTTWAGAAALPSARSHMGYAALGGRIYAIGGQFGNDDELTTTDLVHVWDPAVPGTWTARAPLPAAASHMSSSTFVRNDRIIVAGGETDHEAATANVFSYDPGSNTWQSLTPLPAPRFSGAARAIGGAIYFTGGSNTTTTYRGVLAG